MARSLEYFEPNGTTAIASKSYDFGSRLAGTSAAVKLWLRNNGDSALSAGFTERLIDNLLNSGIGIIKAALDTAAVRPPYGGTVVLGNGAPAGGHVLVNGQTWYFRVTRVNATGETQGSYEFSYTIADATKDVDLSWTLPAGPTSTSIRVYATQTSGDYSAANVRIATGLGGSATTFTWDGTAPAAATFPTANTTASASGPNYGTAPSLATSDMLLGALAVGEARALWFGYELSGSAGDAVYNVSLRPIEV